MAHYSTGDATAALRRMVDELESESKRTSLGAGSMPGPNSTLGIVLNGTSIDFMIPGGPAHEEEVLEPRDEILEVDGVAVDRNNINQALKGPDEIGSMVRLGVRKAEDGKRVDVVLKRTSLTYIHHMQVYLELMDQLKGACKRNPDLADLVRRVASKVKEMDTYHSSVEHELRKSLRKFNAALPQMVDLLRRAPQTGGRENGSSASSAETQRIIDRLQHQLQVAEEHQQQLKQQLETSARMSAGNSSDSEAVQRLQVLLRETEKDKSSLQFRADQMSKELQRLKLQLTDAGQGTPANSRLSEIRTARREHYIMMEQEIEDLSMQVQDYESVLATSRQELDECKMRESKAQEQVLQFTRQLEKKHKECATVQAEVFRLNRLKDQEADTALLRQQLKEAERQLQHAMDRETELDSKLSRNTEHLQQYQTEVSMRESEFRADISGLKEQLRACQGEVQDMNKDCEKLRMSEHSMQQTLLEVQSELEAYKHRAADIETDLTRRHQNARDELTQCQNRLQQINDQLNDALQSERRLKTMSSEAHAIAESLQAARTQSEKDFSERLQAMEEELQRAQAKVLHYKSREQELTTKENALNRRIREMEDELRTVQNSLRDTQAGLHHANSKIVELSDKVSQQQLDRSKLEEVAMTTKDSLSREKQKLTSRLSAAEDAVKQLEAQLSETKMSLRRSQDHVRDLEAKAQELERNLSNSHHETQSLSDDFSQHSKARDWQLEALKTRLQIADDKCKKACAREDDLLQQLEARQTELARLECDSVQKQMESRQLIDTLRLKIKSLEDVLGHTKKDNDSLHRLLEMPAEEFAFQAIERSGPMARAFRKSELPGKRSSMDASSLPPPIPRKSLMPPEEPPAMPPLHASGNFSKLSTARNPVPGEECDLPERDADLQQQVVELRAKMKAMEMEVSGSPHVHAPSGDLNNSSWETGSVVDSGGGSAIRGVIRNTVSPVANNIIQSLASSSYMPSKRQSGMHVARHSQGGANYLI